MKIKNLTLQLLLWAEIVRVSTFRLATVGGTWMQSRVALAADHLVAVVLLRQKTQRRLDDPASQTQHQVKGGLLLNIVVGQSASVFQLFSGEDQTLLIRGDSFLILNFRFHIFNRVRRLDLKGDSLAGQGFHENLHGGDAETKFRVL